MRTLLKTVILFILLVWSHVILSAEQATKTLSSSPITASVLLETLLGLVLVLVIIAFLAWLLRKSGSFQSSSTGDMHIISSLALGPRERAVLLKIGEQQILVGVTAQHVQTLHILEKNIDAQNKSNTPPHFAERLQKMMQQRGDS